MREYKFRGLNRPSGEWIYGYLVVDDKYCQILQHDDVPVIVDPDTVGLFTSRRDKKGQEIYVDDLIFNEDRSCYGAVYYCEDRAMFRVSYETDDFPLWEAIANSRHVVGNIHQHPELVPTR